MMSLAQQQEAALSSLITLPDAHGDKHCLIWMQSKTSVLWKSDGDEKITITKITKACERLTGIRQR